MTDAIDQGPRAAAARLAQESQAAAGRLVAAARPLAAAAALTLLRRLRAALPRLLLLGAAAGVIASGASLIMAGEKPELAPSIDAAGLEESAEPAGQWTEIARPIELFALESPDVPAGSRRYEARRHSATGAREDSLGFNDFSDDRLTLTMRFRRPGAVPAPPASLFVETVRGAADEGVTVLRMAAPVDMATKFGPAETADAELAAGDLRRSCIAFRFEPVPGALAVAGTACGAERRPIDRAQLACLIDRASLLGSADEAVRQAFARAELNRLPSCASRLPGAQRRAGWLDPAGRAPPLKGATAARR